jgi:hypothetical protein
VLEPLCEDHQAGERKRARIMGLTKQALIEQQEKEAQEVVAACQVCGADITSERLVEMPYDGGEPVFILCENCIGADEEERKLEKEAERLEEIKQRRSAVLGAFARLKEKISTAEVEQCFNLTKEFYEKVEEDIDWLVAKYEEVLDRLGEARKQVKSQVDDVQKMTFIRDTLERASRADMSLETTDRFIVREIQRILKK